MAYKDTNFIHLKQGQILDKESDLLKELEDLKIELEEETCKELIKDFEERIEEIGHELTALELFSN